ncbi:MAG: hypothetical protein WAT93_13340 [Pontixanthobacter sp.]
MRSFVQWPAPIPGGGRTEESALTFDQARTHRILVLPAFFDEANKIRRQTVEVMHRLDLSGIDSILPDLPGCNESTEPHEVQTLEDWRFAAEAAALYFDATHVLTMRSGAMLAPPDMPGWRYAATGGRQVLRAMLRARAISARESGKEETIAQLEAMARAEGIELAGWKIGSAMFSALSDTKTPPQENLIDITQDMVGGAGLWLRAEPDEDPEQADALAAIIAIGMAGA